MSLSQNIVIYGGCFVLGLMTPPARSLKEFCIGLPVLFLAGTAWSVMWHLFFKSDYYHNLQAAVGFNLGF